MDEKHTRIGIIGAGLISNYHIPSLQEAGAEVVVICDMDKAKAQGQAQKYNIIDYTMEYQKVLERTDVDAVLIATPDFTHAEIASAATGAGKAVIVQKPLGRNPQECLKIIRSAEDARVPLYVSFMHRYFDEVETFRDMLSKEVLGEVQLIRQRNTGSTPNWADWYYSKEKVGGGIVLTLGVHGIDLIRYLFGEIEAVKAITARMNEMRKMIDGSEVIQDNEDLAVAIYRLASGAFAIHEMAYTEVEVTDRFRMEIHGSKGTAWLRTERGLLSVYAPSYFGQEGWFDKKLSLTELGFRHHSHLLRMLQGKEPQDTTARDGLISVLITEAIYRSLATGDWEKIHMP
jgi:predicted dehydrogenase